MTLSPPKDCPAYPSLVTVDQARQNNEPMPIQLGFDVDTKRETTSASIVAVINSKNDLTKSKQLHASGPSKHPRWPAGSLESVGGRFAPADETLGAAPGYESSASTRTAQALPIPFEAVTPRGAIPWPSEIAPPLGIYPRGSWSIHIRTTRNVNGSGPQRCFIVGS